MFLKDYMKKDNKCFSVEKDNNDKSLQDGRAIAMTIGRFT